MTVQLTEVKLGFGASRLGQRRQFREGGFVAAPPEGLQSGLQVRPRRDGRQEKGHPAKHDLLHLYRLHRGGIQVPRENRPTGKARQDFRVRPFIRRPEPNPPGPCSGPLSAPTAYHRFSGKETHPEKNPIDDTPKTPNT